LNFGQLFDPDQQDIHVLAGLAVINQEFSVLSRVKDYLVKTNKVPDWLIY